MKRPYKSKSGKNSGVTAFEIGEDFIKIWFGNHPYTYSYSSAGRNTVEYMKTLAQRNRGLSTFISRKRPKYGVRH